MHRLVIWGFALALIPLSMAVVWEAAISIRAFVAQMARRQRMPASQTRDS